MTAKNCSLIISTFNRPDALRRCIESALDQSRMPDEIIIADDGSKDETVQLVASLKASTKVPIVHVWQPDEGYQLARIRNKAFITADTEYLLQVDGDLVLHRDFVADHIRMSTPSAFVSGSRLNMDDTLTRKVLDGSVPLRDIPRHKKHLAKRYNGVHSPVLSRLNYHLQVSPKNYKYVLGCNMAFWKKDLERVNGYNEAFKGWGKEDNDMAVRLTNAGIRLRFIKYGAIAYHLAHPVADLSFVPENESMLYKSLNEKIAFVEAGMSRHGKKANS